MCDFFKISGYLYCESVFYIPMMNKLRFVQRQQLTNIGSFFFVESYIVYRNNNITFNHNNFRYTK